MESPLVSIRCLVYNHGPYLRQCLDGFIMQKTNFKFEAIVHDDASTDNSASIIKEYAERYPEIIKPIYETENQYSKGDGSLGRIMNNAIHPDSKYVAMCEGDDYWIDPYKLQKQVDFLNSHPDYSFCCHRFSIFDQENNVLRKEYADHYYIDNNDLEISEYLFFKTWVTQPLTAVIRKTSYFEIIKQQKKYSYYRDVHLFYHLLQVGKGISLNANMGIYRWHLNGIASKIDSDKKNELRYNIFSELYKNNINDDCLAKFYIKSVVKHMLLKNIKEKKIIYANSKKYMKGVNKVICQIFAYTPKSILYLICAMKRKMKNKK